MSAIMSAICYCGRMIRRTLGTLLSFALGFGVVAVYMAATADADPVPPLDPELAKQCAAVLAEDPEELAQWLADRNGITMDKARQTVADAITFVCATP